MFEMPEHQCINGRISIFKPLHPSEMHINECDLE